MIFNLLSCVDQFEFEWVSIFGSIMDNLCQTLLQICLLPWSHILQLHPKDLKKLKLFRLWPSAFLTGILFGILGKFLNEFHNHLQNSNYKVEKHQIVRFPFELQLLQKNKNREFAFGIWSPTDLMKQIELFCWYLKCCSIIKKLYFT